MSFAFLSFWFDIAKGKMKKINRYNEASYSNPFTLLKEYAFY